MLVNRILVQTTPVAATTAAVGARTVGELMVAQVDVQDAADWKNPYLVITRDGFNVRFQGGGSLGRYLCSLELWSDSPIRRGLTDAWLQNQKSEFGSSEMAR